MRMLESNLYPRGFGASMSDEEARQAAEDYYYAALDLVAEGHHEQAVEQYQKSLASDPTFTEAMHGLSRALHDLNRLDEAIAVARRVFAVRTSTLLRGFRLSCFDNHAFNCRRAAGVNSLKKMPARPVSSAQVTSPLPSIM